jgi:hypothetical protein
MTAVAWFTIVVAVLIVGITAVGLMRVIFHLRATRATLGQVLGSVTVVAQQTTAVPAVVASVNTSLQPVRDFCESVMNS